MDTTKLIPRLITGFIVFVILLTQAPPTQAVTIQWHSCTVLYSVKDHGYSLDALRVAIKDVEKASGLDFKKVPWDQADMQINVGRKGKDKEDLGAARTWYYGTHIQSASVRIYRLTYMSSWIIKMNVYRHELGHALGLNHVKSNDIMNKYMSENRSKDLWKSKLKKRYKECK